MVMASHPLAQFRNEKGLSPADLARLLGVTRPTIHRWESGERQIGRDKLDGVSEKTGIPARNLRPDLAQHFEAAE